MSDAAWRKQVAETSSASAKGAALAVAKAAAAVAAALAEDAATLPMDDSTVNFSLAVGDDGFVAASFDVVAIPSAAARRARYESFLFEPEAPPEPTDAQWRAGVAATTAANASAATTAVTSAAVGTAMAAQAKWEKDAPWRAGVRASLAALPSHAQAAVKEAAGAVARALADDVPRRYSTAEWPREYSVSKAEADAAVAAQRTAARKADALALSVATELVENAVLDALAPYKAAEEAAAADAARAKAEAWQQATATRSRLESFAAEPDALPTKRRAPPTGTPDTLSPVASSRGGSQRSSKFLGGFASAPASARSSKLLSPRGGGGSGKMESPRQVGHGVWLKADV